ncbi:hypothetical protein BEWA_013060 [Theileria equi strain WA]|uniref:Signal peptide containing protein n=1 Tax=Theileria equi strain WA TaxID=1537102 RepID=L1LBF8_THEEQ|nr:hypothetical protein BEWA_013060 [Theileria equi strain WA]EKX72747.1 hypothetical protein BEWA_013060 [Theileria equi strain WA]|eukprot:XP_004832199.1 hypothetical protein BEWA_013060 [Theileria equi strain WA]
MNVFSVLFTVSLVGLCHCGELGSLRKETGDVVLDLSSPDSSSLSLGDYLIHGVSHKAFVPKVGSFLVAIVDNRDTLWTSTDPQEGCTGAYLFSREGHSSLLSVYTRGAGDETFCFEKDAGAWKNVDKRYFEHRLHLMKDFSASAGERLGGPETLPEDAVGAPKEHAAELDFATLGCPLEGFSGTEAKPKVTLPPTESNNNSEDASENKVEGGAPDDEEESGDIPPESSPSTAAEPSPTEDTEQTAVSSSDPVDQQPTEVSELQESEPLQSTESPQEVAYQQSEAPVETTSDNVREPEVPEDSKDDNPEVTPQEVAYQQSEAPLEDPKPVSNEEESSNEQEELGDLDDQDSEETLVEEVQPEVAPAESPEDDEPGNGSEKEFGDSESTGYESSDNNLPETKVEEPEEPVSPFLDKVDSTLFNVENGQEDGVPVLKLKVKEGIKADKLTFGDLTLWQGQNSGDSCSTATLYMGENEPIAASYRFKRDGKLIEGYRKFVDGNWFQVNSAGFKKLIGKDDHVTKPKEPSTNGGSKENLRAVPPQHGEVSSEEAQVEVASDTALQEGENVDKPEVPPDEESPVTASSGQGGPVLDLANPDQSKVHIGDRSGNGVNSKKYYPKDGYDIGSVTDGDKELWKSTGAGQKCCFARFYSKGESILVTIGISKGSDSEAKFFEKVGGQWKGLNRDVFFNKFNEMIKS